MVKPHTPTLSWIFIFTALACSDPSLLIPSSNDIAGYRLISLQTPSTPHDLEIFINGGALVFIDDGFVSGVFAMYVKGDTIVDLVVFDQGTPSNAGKAYSQMKASVGASITCSSCADSCAHDDYSVRWGDLYAAKDNYIIQVTNSGAPNLDVQMEFLEFVCGKIGATRSKGVFRPVAERQAHTSSQFYDVRGRRVLSSKIKQGYAGGSSGILLRQQNGVISREILR